MRAHFLALAMALGLAISSTAHAQQAAPVRTPATSVTLTGEQWACLGSRLANLQSSSSDVVRVPLSPCGQGSGTRGVTRSTAASNRAATHAVPSDSRITRAPLYLSKAQLSCIQQQLPQLQQATEPMTVDLSRCALS